MVLTRLQVNRSLQRRVAPKFDLGFATIRETGVVDQAALYGNSFDSKLRPPRRSDAGPHLLREEVTESCFRGEATTPL